MPPTFPSQPSLELSILDTLRQISRMTRCGPRLMLRAVKLLVRQHRAARVRQQHAAEGLQVPPFAIFSVTSQCNLNCFGCYANVLHQHSARDEMDEERIVNLFSEASQLGVSVMLLAGGEPLQKTRLLQMTQNEPGILFLLFTNGSLLDHLAIQQLRKQPHVIPVLSIEGSEPATDARRGQGTHARIAAAMQELKRARIFFGTAITLTGENFGHATAREHVQSLITQGCRLFFYINYIPVVPDTQHLTLSRLQVKELDRRLGEYRHQLPSLFIAFPQDEVSLGGCLAAGRGFFHINAVGDLEPCPFSPYSDRNIRDGSLADALQSPLFLRIRTSGKSLDETGGQCALWEQRAWVEGLLSPRDSA